MNRAFFAYLPSVSLLYVSFLFVILLVSYQPHLVFAEEKLTRLRALGDAKGTFQTNYRGTRVTNVQVRIKNVGSADADNVLVMGVLPDGNRVTLSGPSSLKRFGTATYSGSPWTYLTKEGRIGVEISCSNCRN